MGYGLKSPAFQLGNLKKLWSIWEYGLPGLWDKRASTVILLVIPDSHSHRVVAYSSQILAVCYIRHFLAIVLHPQFNSVQLKPVTQEVRFMCAGTIANVGAARNYGACSHIKIHTSP